MKSWILALPLAFLVTGCLSHMPTDRDPVHARDIRWSPDFASAQREAAASERPVLVCMIGGDILDQC